MRPVRFEEGRRVDDLTEWLATGYAGAYRTACLILRNPADAEEAVQDAFLRAWRFRAAAPRDEGWHPWLYRVVVNACCSKLRREAAYRDHLPDEHLAERPDDGPGPDVIALHAESTDAVIAALADLPLPLRTPIVLRYYAGLSEREIATAIGRRPGTVKSRLHDARRRLAADPRLRELATTSEENAR